jgi:hypothetical protein
MDFVLAPMGTVAISTVHVHIEIHEKFFPFSQMSVAVCLLLKLRRPTRLPFSPCSTVPPPLPCLKKVGTEQGARSLLASLSPGER